MQRSVIGNAAWKFIPTAVETGVNLSPTTIVATLKGVCLK